MKRGRKTSYTEEENKLINKILNEYSYNLQQGFRKLEELTGKNSNSISVYWYTKLRPKVIESKNHSFSIVGKEAYGSCKNIHKDKKLLITCKIGINGFFYESSTSTWSNNFTF